MDGNIIIKLLIILLFSIHLLYNFKEQFTTLFFTSDDFAEKDKNLAINWRDTSSDNVTEEEEKGPKIEEKYLEIAEDGYKTGKYDIQYHETENSIEQKNKEDYNYDYIKVSKNKQVKRLRIQNKILYNNPIDYKYGITPYVPSYTDSVLLSKMRPRSYDFSKAL